MAATIISTENVWINGDLEGTSPTITVPADCTCIVALHAGYCAQNTEMERRLCSMLREYAN